MSFKSKLRIMLFLSLFMMLFIILFEVPMHIVNIIAFAICLLIFSVAGLFYVIYKAIEEIDEEDDDKKC